MLTDKIYAFCYANSNKDSVFNEILLLEEDLHSCQEKGSKIGRRTLYSEIRGMGGMMKVDVNLSS